MAISGNGRRLESGDLVRVKSGGHIMTASRVDYQVQRPYARCVWVDARNTVHFVSIDLDGLEWVSPEDQHTNA